MSKNLDMGKNLSESIEFALESHRIRPLAKRLERVLADRFDLEGYLTEENGYPQLVLQRDSEGKAIVIEEKRGEVESDCIWSATRYAGEKTSNFIWKRDIINQILWLVSDSAREPTTDRKTRSESRSETRDMAPEPTRGTKTSMSNNNQNTNKLAHAKDIFDILFRIMDEETFPKESRMQLINIGVTEILGIKSFHTIFDDIQKKKETNALSSKISQLEDIIKKMGANITNPSGNEGFMTKKTSNLGKAGKFTDPSEEDDEHDDEMEEFDRELEDMEDEE